MRKTLLRVGTLLGGAGAMLGAGTLVHCYSEEDTTVDIPTACDVATLRNDPGERTLKVYAETAVELRDKAAALQKRLMDVCNAINRESGAQEGADLALACNKIADRITTAANIPPLPDGGGRPVWVVMSFDDSTCTNNLTAEAECTTKCADAPCNAETACPPAARTGACAGECKGTCVDDSQNTACTGECRGSCALTPDGGAACPGLECVGQCTSATWTGRCSLGCDRGFLGKCSGTCAGTCDGAPVGPQPEDAGVADAGDGGDGGEGGADAGTPPAPGGQDGNCAGICAGTCSANASGSCTSRCRGDFSGGECTGGPARCLGRCVGAAGPCTETCTGRCLSLPKAGACAGSCIGECSQPTGVATACNGDSTCVANPQCKLVCAVKGALASTCAPPKEVGVRVAGDQALYAALKKNLPEFVAVAQEARLLNQRSFGLARVTLDDYKALGATRDRARLCVTSTGQVIEQARASLARTVTATQVVQGIKF